MLILFRDQGSGMSRPLPWSSWSTSIRTEKYRYVEWRDQESGEVLARELYNHGKDPGENVNVAGKGEDGETVAKLSEWLEER